jgi:hypothetical protein
MHRYQMQHWSSARMTRAAELCGLVLRPRTRFSGAPTDENGWQVD